MEAGRHAQRTDDRFPDGYGTDSPLYRADLFKEAGLPSEPAEVSRQLNSWEAYAAAGEQIKEKLGARYF